MLAGKLPMELLSRLLADIDVTDPRVALGARAGEDAALIDMGDRYLVAKTDPITFATDLIGWYLVQVNSNDLAAMGATPRWLMATLLLPEGTTERQTETIFTQLLDACDSLGITLIGGHTEITYDLPRPIAMGAMLGEVAKDKVVLTSGAQVGDSIVLTQGVAIEGASILAREAEDTLTVKGVPQAVIESAKSFLFNPGISVAKAAKIACDTAAVHAMHDPTEGGVVTALLELATAAKVGLTVEAERIPILPECRIICDALSLDPLGLIASGALLATLPAADAERLVDALGREGIPAAVIGRVTAQEAGLRLMSEGVEGTLPVFERDELARFFGG